MDVLWSPWRYDYIKGSESANPVSCIFCDILTNSATDEDNYILKRAEFCFVILNVYPYTSGHLMVVPYDHVATLSRTDKLISDEIMDVTKTAEAAIIEEYSPDGMNIGMNLGKAAGAGVDAHLHMHILPRWSGDVNFMTAIGQTRTLPESLQSSYQKLRKRF